MPAPTTVQVTGIAEYSAAILEAAERAQTTTLWFRGTSVASRPLVPRLFRSDKTALELVNLESEMLAQFQSRSTPMLEHELDSKWGYLFMMQHYGVPTRLLDWSENAMLALYFALSGAMRRAYDSAAAVWVLDPSAWNLATFPGMNPPGKALHADNSSLHNFAPGRELDEMAIGAAAMFGRYNNPRISAQRGVFTVFGREKEPMEAIFESDGFPEGALTQVEMPPHSLEEMNDHVRVLGFRESMVYPDLAGLATELRTEQGLQ